MSSCPSWTLRSWLPLLCGINHCQRPDCWLGPGSPQGTGHGFPERDCGPLPKVDMRHMGTGAQHTLSTETLCRWTGHVGRSSRSQTTLSHMSPNGLSASLKLTAGTSLWCVRRAPLEHLSKLRSEPRPRRTDHDQLGFSDAPRPRRASTAEPVSWDFDEEKPTPTEPSAPGRRATVDLESYEPSTARSAGSASRVSGSRAERCGESPASTQCAPAIS